MRKMIMPLHHHISKTERIFEEEYPLPLSFIIDVNHDCNFDCKMCVKRTMKTPHGQRKIEDFITLVDKLPWIREVLLGALGETFLYKDIKTAWEYLESKKIRCPVTTNASLISPDNLESIPLNTQMHISIEGDGHIAAYKKVGTSLSRIKESIRLVRNMRPDIGIVINHLVFKTNIRKARELIDFCYEVGASIIFFFPMYFSPKLEKELSAFYLKDLEGQMKSLELLCKEKGVRYHMTSPTMRERPCMRALTQPIVAFDGTVYPCDYIYQNIENTKDGTWKSWYRGMGMEVPQHQYAMGNLYEEDFIKMWNSKKWKTLRRKITQLNKEGLGKSFEEVSEETDLSLPFEHCKVCLARWSRCL